MEGDGRRRVREGKVRKEKGGGKGRGGKTSGFAPPRKIS